MADVKQAKRGVSTDADRYRQLVGVTRAFVFHVEVDNGRVVRTIHFPGVEQVTGYAPEDYRENPLLWCAMVPPEDRALVLAQAEQVLQGVTPPPIEHRLCRKDGEVLWVCNTTVPQHDREGRMIGYSGVVHDITGRKRAEERLADLVRQLERSNRDLEQFAYIASHDLQEPLRMVASYVQLLAQRYRGRFDADADAFIGYAVDGALRMQKMVNDLLAFARVGTQGKEFTPVDLEAVLQNVLADLRVAIEESGAQVTHDPLPTLTADGAQIGVVLQNLVENAIKFRGEVVPRIHVSAERQGGEWVVSVRDNGIGIEPAYFSRIFVIFQRLRSGAKCPGSGIGLAVCKKIVERHGGRIWVESQPGSGSTFRFALPAQERI
jgi:PAS domain S-box-containing protein